MGSETTPHYVVKKSLLHVPASKISKQVPGHSEAKPRGYCTTVLGAVHRVIHSRMCGLAPLRPEGVARKSSSPLAEEEHLGTEPLNEADYNTRAGRQV